VSLCPESMSSRVATPLCTINWPFVYTYPDTVKSLVYGTNYIEPGNDAQADVGFDTDEPAAERNRIALHQYLAGMHTGKDRGHPPWEQEPA